MKPDKEALLVNGMRAGGRSILKEGDHFRVRVMETGSMEGIVPAPQCPLIFFMKMKTSLS